MASSMYAWSFGSEHSSNAMMMSAPRFSWIAIDLSGVNEADSSALSLLLEWQRAAKARGFRIKYSGLPDNLRSLAQVYGVLDLLALE